MLQLFVVYPKTIVRSSDNAEEAKLLLKFCFFQLQASHVCGEVCVDKIEQEKKYLVTGKIVTSSKNIYLFILQRER